MNLDSKNNKVKFGSEIKKIEVYLPGKILKNSTLEKEFSEWSANKIEKKTGIRERHIVNEDETSLDIGFEVAKKVLQGYDKSQIDFILFCTQSPDYYLPS